MLKKGQITEGIVTEVGFPNKGRVYIEKTDRYVTVKNGIPGQRVKIVVKRVRPDSAEGYILEVLEPSEIETEARCPHFGECGGCAYQNLPYKEQLKLKEAQVKSLMDEAVAGEYQWDGIQASPVQEGYRNKMEFSFGDEYKDGPLALGMHKQGSFYDIVNVTGCRIVDEDYRRILECTLAFARETGISYYHKLRHSGFFRHLLVRKAVKTGEILIDIVTTGAGNPAWQEWAERLLALPLDGKIAGILHTRNDSVADVVKNEGTEIIFGQDYFFEELLGLRFKVTPFSFFQTNSLGAEVLYDVARSYVGDTRDKVIYDLYSGTGTIAQMLAPVAKKVVGVEIVEEAVQAAKENANMNGLDNCVFWAGDVLRVMDELGEVPDLIVLDPPRDGVHPKALEKITNFRVEKIVYIACKPTSLARDLEMLQGRGYKVERIGCIDLFPEVRHVESICLMSRIDK